MNLEEKNGPKRLNFISKFYWQKTENDVHASTLTGIIDNFWNRFVNFNWNGKYSSELILWDILEMKSAQLTCNGQINESC